MGASTCQDTIGRTWIKLELPIHENFYVSITRVVPWIAAFGTAPVLGSLDRGFRNGSRPSTLVFEKLKDHRQLLGGF